MAFTYKNYEEDDEVKKSRAAKDAASTYTQSSDVKEAKQNLKTQEAAKPQQWTGSQYDDTIKNVMSQYQQRQPFSYDVNGDELYKQYAQMYMRNGKQAMEDTIGTASAMTGGYGNSYAQTAGNHAYNSYMEQLNDVIPTLYQMAYERYQNEGSELMNQYDMLSSERSNEYGQYRDTVGDWQTEVDRLTDAYNTERDVDYSMYSDNRDYTAGRYDTEVNRDYGIYADTYDRAFGEYEQEVSEDQWNRNFNEGVRESLVDEALAQAELDEKIRANKADEELERDKHNEDVEARKAGNDLAQKELDQDADQFDRDLDYKNRVLESSKTSKETSGTEATEETEGNADNPEDDRVEGTTRAQNWVDKFNTASMQRLNNREDVIKEEVNKALESGDLTIGEAAYIFKKLYIV